MNSDRGFIAANCSGPKNPAFPGRPSTCRLTTSATASSSSSERMRRALPWAGRSAVSKNTTRMPIASARFDSWVPMLP